MYFDVIFYIQIKKKLKDPSLQTKKLRKLIILMHPQTKAKKLLMFTLNILLNHIYKGE